MTRISFIFAVSENGVIGKSGGLPWHLPADLRFFKQVTMGKPLIMGRKTYESIGRSLPGRENIILTRNKHYEAPGCIIASSISEALSIAGSVPEIMIIGGAEIYNLFLPAVNRIYMTRVAATIPDGDTFMPPIDWNEWHEVSREFHPADEHHPFQFEWLVLERV